MATKTVQDSSLTSIANAIRTKGGTTAPLEFPTDFVTAIQDIPTGGGGASVSPKEVNFYDYDGTVVDAYTASEFAALSAMPANPSHDGLTAQGWNWELADAQAHVAKYGRLNIGQLYVIASGDTEIDIQLGIGRNKPYLGCCPNGTVEIDWGDGSAHDTLTGTSTSSLRSVQHTYPDTGEMFTIKLHMESGTLSFTGSSSSGSQVIYNGGTGSSNGQISYQGAIKAVRFGAHISILNGYAFNKCAGLSSVVMPNGLNIGTHAFDGCSALKAIVLPLRMQSGSYAFYNCTSLSVVVSPMISTTFGNNYLFYNCVSLASMFFPKFTTIINNSMFDSCASLSAIVIPETVTNILANAFRACSSLAQLTFTSATPPTVSSANAFSGLPSDCIVYVPAGTLTDYQAASNYSDIASKMVEMSA